LIATQRLLAWALGVSNIQNAGKHRSAARFGADTGHQKLTKLRDSSQKLPDLQKNQAGAHAGWCFAAIIFVANGI
jgi:hypothetical protein